MNNKSIKLTLIIVCLILIPLICVLLIVDSINHFKTNDPIEEQLPVEETIKDIPVPTSEIFIEAEGNNPDIHDYFTDEQINMIAIVKYNEAGESLDIHEQRAWVWCFLNILEHEGCPDTVEGLIFTPGIYYGRVPDYPLTEGNKKVVEEVIMDWIAEKAGCPYIVRELPREYATYAGNGYHNFYKTIPDNGIHLTGGEFA